MKKVILTLASVLAATAFAPEASAIPAFARQTGMACTACHFQHFPLLNGFGRAFKAGGFTMIGSEAKVEGEHGLSLPATLNMSGLATAGLQMESDMAGAGKPNGTDGSNNTWFVPNGGGELSIFFGGRVSENVGLLSEIAFPDAALNVMNVKMPMIFDVGGGNKAGIVFTNAGGAYAMELLNTGAVSTHRLMGDKGNGASGGAGNHINVTSASMYLGTKGAGGPGFSLVGSGNWGFVNVGTYNVGAVGGGQMNALKTTYVRGAATFDAAGWDTAVGVQMFSGTEGQAVAGVAGQATKVTVIDAQAQGEAAGMPLGIYFSNGSAPTSTTGNLFNPNNVTKKTSTNIAAELGVIPNVATVQLAYRAGKNGAASGANGDNGVMIGATYKLVQNVALSLTRSSNSGSAYNGVVVPGKTQTTFLIEALF